jgi:hypothetical protein
VSDCLVCTEPLVSPDSQARGSHYECMTLGIVGHDVGLCGCTQYEGMTMRAAGIECILRFRRVAIEKGFPA